MKFTKGNFNRLIDAGARRKDILDCMGITLPELNAFLREHGASSFGQYADLRINRPKIKGIVLLGEKIMNELHRNAPPFSKFRTATAFANNKEVAGVNAMLLEDNSALVRVVVNGDPTFITFMVPKAWMDSVHEIGMVPTDVALEFTRAYAEM